VDHIPGGNFSATIAAIKCAGGFDERLNYGAALYEETDFALRLRRTQFKINFNGNARITHLADENGGCRIADIALYVKALIHNRSMFIYRYSTWYQRPVAIIRLVILVLAYAKAHKKIGLLLHIPMEIAKGMKDAHLAPLCTTVKAKLQ
jgi:GT2 family glycosyltransferase